MLNKKITYNIYLIKPDFVKDKKYLHKTEGCDHFKVPISGHPDAEIYLKTEKSKAHCWNMLLPFQISQIKWDKYKTTNLYGIILINVNNRVFALTSGLGRYLLHPFSFENQFGFKIVLNSINPQTINQISKKTLSQNPKTSVEQVSKGVNIRQFGIDDFMDLIQRVKGKSKLEKLGATLDGEHSLKISIPYELHQLPELLKECLKTFKSNAYKKYFPDIDNLSQVKDKQQIIFLNDELEKRLNSELQRLTLNQVLSDDIWASIPEIIIDDEFECFTYKNSVNALFYHDIELKDILTERYLRSNKTSTRFISLSSLQSDQIYIRKANGTIYPKWKAIQSINAVLEKENDTFVFSENNWYRISSFYIDELNKKIKNIKSSNLLMDDWPHDKDEKDYLKGRPLKNISEYLILDRENIYIKGQSPIESCDIYTKNRLMIHVKRYGSSSLLGHLFNQGYVSADLLLNSIEFKSLLNKKLEDEYKIDTINPGDFTVAYVIGTKYKDNVELPLFSKIILTKVHDDLIKKGFNVTLDYCNMTII